MKNILQLPINDHFYLRQTILEDAEETFALVDKNRNYLRKWMPWVDRVQSAEDCRKNIESQQQDPNASPEFCLVDHERIVGRLGFHLIDHANRSTSIGYWLDENHQGNGLMTMAVKAATEYAFDSLHIHRLVIRAGVKNKGSRAIAERLGYTYEGTARDAEWIYDHFIDLAIYAKLASEHA